MRSSERGRKRKKKGDMFAAAATLAIAAAAKSEPSQQPTKMVVRKRSEIENTQQTSVLLQYTHTDTMATHTAIAPWIESIVDCINGAPMNAKCVREK